ncbi:MAG TPA: hypothetical protein VK176_02125 [Phycisphaerales bacterium]|nr:hypothetical protein [Phycisphaerales bacterium]
MQRKDVQTHPDPSSHQPHRTPARVFGLDRLARAFALAAAARAADDAERPGFLRELVDLAAAPEPRITSIARVLSARAGRLGIRTSPPEPAIFVPLVQVWDLVETDARKVFISISAPGVIDAAVQVLASPEAAMRRAAILALKDVASPDSLAAIVPSLVDPDPAVASLADRAFGAIVHGWVQQGLQAGDLSKHLPQVGDTIIRACIAAGRERLKGPPLAALELLTPELMMPSAGSRIGELARWIREQGGQDPGLRRTIRGLKGPLCRLRAWEWLAHKPLASVCIDRLARAHDLEEHEAVLSNAHLLLNPRRALAAHAIGRAANLAPVQARVAGGEVGAPASSVIPPASAVPLPGEVDQLSHRAKWGLTYFASAIGLSLPRRRSVLDPLLTDDAPGVRLSAARAVLHEDLADYCFDEDLAVARTAVTRWSHLGLGRVRAITPVDAAARRRLLTRLARSPHGAIRRIACDDLRRLDPILAWEEGGPPMDLAITAGHDPHAIVQKLDEELGSDDAHRVARALRVVQRTNLAGQLQHRLAGILSRRSSAAASGAPAQDRNAATIISTISEIDSGVRTPAARQVLEDALSDRDDRVRSNAVDALARDARKSAEPALHMNPLIELKHDAHHRVRGSAIRGMLWAAESAKDLTIPAADAMFEMLEDARPMHRLAGVWLCERWAMGHVRSELDAQRASRRLRSMARHEHDPRLAARASRAERRLRLLSSLPAHEQASHDDGAEEILEGEMA